MAEYDPRWADAITKIESGGDYGQVTPSGNRAAYGRYQVMGENIPEWTQAALGKTLTPEQFVADKDAQDAVFKHRFSSYVDKYGTPQDAASAWFTGRPINASSSAASDRFGTTGSSYVAKFNKYMGETPDGPTAIQTAMGGTRSQQPRSTAMGYAPEDNPNGALSSAPPPGALSAIGGGAAPQPSWLETLGQTLQEMAPGIAQDPDHARALASVAANSRKVASDTGTWSMHMLPNGQMARINGKTGAVVLDRGSYGKPEKDPGDCREFRV